MNLAVSGNGLAVVMNHVDVTFSRRKCIHECSKNISVISVFVLKISGVVHIMGDIAWIFA